MKYIEDAEDEKDIKQLEIDIKELEIDKLDTDSKSEKDFIKAEINDLKQDIKDKKDDLKRQKEKVENFVIYSINKYRSFIEKYLQSMGFYYEIQSSRDKIAIFIDIYSNKEKDIILDDLVDANVQFTESNRRNLGMKKYREQLDAEDSIYLNPIPEVMPDENVEIVYGFVVTYTSNLSGLTTSINVTQDNYKSMADLEGRVVTELGNDVKITSIVDYDQELIYFNLAVQEDGKLNKEFMTMIFEDACLDAKIDLLEENGFEVNIENITEIEVFTPSEKMVSFPAFILSKENKSLYTALEKEGMAFFDIVGWLNTIVSENKLIYRDCGADTVVYSFIELPPTEDIITEKKKLGEISNAFNKYVKFVKDKGHITRSSTSVLRDYIDTYKSSLSMEDIDDILSDLWPTTDKDAKWMTRNYAKSIGIKESKKIGETSVERDLDPDKTIIVKGVKGMKSTPFIKKFKNMAAYDKWSDSEDFGNYEIYQIMNESNLSEGILVYANESPEAVACFKLWDDMLGEMFNTNDVSSFKFKRAARNKYGISQDVINDAWDKWYDAVVRD